MFRAMLKPLPSSVCLKGFSTRRCIQSIYLFGMDEQFASVKDIQEHLTLWQGTVGQVHRAPKFRKSATELLAIDWIRHHCNRGRLFACPEHLVRFVPFHGYSHHGEQSAVLDAVVAVSVAEELLLDRIDVCQFDNLVVFKILNTTPNRRYLLGPTHMPRAPNSMAVSQYKIESSSPEGRSMVLRPECNIKLVDISFWASCHFPELLQNLWTFTEMNYGSKLTISRKALKLSLPQISIVRPLPIEKRDAALVAVLETGDMLESHTTPAYRCITQLIRSDVFAELGNFIQAEIKLKRSRGHVLISVSFYFQEATVHLQGE